MCATPLHRKFNNPLKIVEYIEVYRMLGALKFYIYNDSSTQNVAEVLKHYENEGILEVFDFKTEKGSLDYP